MLKYLGNGMIWIIVGLLIMIQTQPDGSLLIDHYMSLKFIMIVCYVIGFTNLILWVLWFTNLGARDINEEWY